MKLIKLSSELGSGFKRQTMISYSHPSFSLPIYNMKMIICLICCESSPILFICLHMHTHCPTGIILELSCIHKYVATVPFLMCPKEILLLQMCVLKTAWLPCDNVWIPTYTFNDWHNCNVELPDYEIPTLNQTASLDLKDTFLLSYWSDKASMRTSLLGKAGWLTLSVLDMVLVPMSIY